MKEDIQDSHEGFTGMVGTDGTEAVQATEDSTVTRNNTEEPPVKDLNIYIELVNCCRKRKMKKKM